jgi:hypothetical protein
MVGPSGFALDATSLYWTDAVWTDYLAAKYEGRVMRVPIVGGMPTKFAGQQQSPYGSIAVDATSVYVNTSYGLMRKLK